MHPCIIGARQALQGVDLGHDELNQPHCLWRGNGDALFDGVIPKNVGRQKPKARIDCMVGSRNQQTKGLFNQALGHADRVLVQVHAQFKNAQMGKLG
jgi:hypothetical protein